MKGKIWNPRRSVTLSLALTYFGALLLLAMMAALPFALPAFLGGCAWGLGLERLTRAVLAVFYACCPAGIAAVVSLSLLLHNIRAEKVFTRQNVTLLRLLSWCFAFVALAALAAACWIQFLFFAIVFVSAGFLAVILRVVKNCFAQAVLLREESDLTI